MDRSIYWTNPMTRTIRRRRLLAGAAAGGLGIALAACAPAKKAQQTGGASGSQAAGTPVRGGTLNIAAVAGPQTWDIHRTTSFFTLIPAGASLSRLMRFKTSTDPKTIEDHDVLGELAVSAESTDAVTWTIKLRPDARFQNIAPVNGHPVEAEDIKATFTRALGQDNPARAALGMIDPTQIQTPDKQTAVFKLNYPYAQFSKTLASPSYSFILPREALAGAYDPAKTLIGSGPFLLDTYQTDVSMTFKRNPDWYEKGLPYVDSVHHSIVPDANTGLAQFQAGNLDYYAPSNTNLDTLKRSTPNARYYNIDPTNGGPTCIFLQLGDPNSPFQDIRARRAVSMAIDRDSLSKAINGPDTIAVFYVGPDFGKWALHDTDLDADTAQYFKFNPTQAKQLWSAAGLADKTFKFVWVANYLAPPYQQGAETIANMLNTAGLKVQLTQVDYQKDYIGGGKGIRYGNYPSDNIILAGVSLLTDPDEYIFNYYDSAGTSGLSRLKDSDLDASIGKARAILNEDQRVKAYLDIQKYLAGKMYTVMGMRNPLAHSAIQPRVQNYQFGTSYAAYNETYARLWLTQ
jgi:peptide/nickel transport system substrate-binding protein